MSLDSDPARGDDGPPINGVPADEWGNWCAHGKRVMVPDPKHDPGDPYPAAVVANPWPCDAPGCTPERLAAELIAEAHEAETQAMQEYRKAVYGG
jgi:hypothetical protein